MSALRPAIESVRLPPEPFVSAHTAAQLLCVKALPSFSLLAQNILLSLSLSPQALATFTFAFMRKKFSGSYLLFTSASRA